MIKILIIWNTHYYNSTRKHANYATTKEIWEGPKKRTTLVKGVTWLLYILTSVWVLHTPNAGKNMHFNFFKPQKGWKCIFQTAFGVCSTQMLVKIYNTWYSGLHHCFACHPGDWIQIMSSIKLGFSYTDSKKRCWAVI